ncbi:hypothetical protein BsWGS_09432 [Bradybaena similaris]
MSSVKAGGHFCLAVEDYIRCFVVTVNYPSMSMSETDLTGLENDTENLISESGIHCDIDIRAILRKVKEDESNAATRTTKKPTGYNDATTIGGCLNTFTGASTQVDRLNCSLVTPYLKCVIRVTGFYTYETSSAVYSTLDSQIKNTYRSIGLFCNVDIQQLSAEVASEQNYRNSGMTTLQSFLRSKE